MTTPYKPLIEPYSPPAPKTPPAITLAAGQPFPRKVPMAVYDRLDPAVRQHFAEVPSLDGDGNAVHVLEWINQGDQGLHADLLAGKSTVRVIEDGMTAAEFDEGQAATRAESKAAFDAEFSRLVQQKADDRDRIRQETEAKEKARVDESRAIDQARLDRAYRDAKVRHDVNEQFLGAPGGVQSVNLP